ncbi:MAG: efflux transporter outer membrane subunit [Betaproteobacteria bacterium]|nr:efflux transporter outer membrane subunit [Betaproteobacteria bacterium]MDE2131678.1 efflux transporter outer membrane subunit [Betaproteobacteria bacterium]
MIKIRLFTAAACCSLLAGCALGPDFARPAAPAAEGYAPGQSVAQLEQASRAASGSPHFNAGKDIPFDWWTLFQSPQLNALIERAFKANPSIEAAQAALRQAQQNTLAQQGFFYPTLGLEYLPTRNKLAGNMGGNSPGVQGNGTIIQTYSNPSGPAPYNGPVYYNFHTAQVTLNYAPDVFGGNRRQVESLEAQAESQKFQLEAAYITLASNVVAAALQEASVRAQIAAMESIVEDNRKLLQISHKQFKYGYINGIDLSTQELALAQTEQALVPLRQQLAQTRDLIRVLAGQLPNEEVPETFELSSIHLPQELPVSLPSRLVEQRPDVRAAEAQLHAANAQIGVAIANRFPQFSITGLLGGEASVPSQMFQTGGGFFNLIGDISLPVFDGGTLSAREQGAREALQQAAAQYKSTVLAAFQNVADTLHAIQSDANAYRAATRSREAAQKALTITRKQYELGQVSYPVLLVADQSYQQSAITSIQVETNRLGDAAALYQALGGGWWHRPDEVRAHSSQGDATP